MKKMLSLLMAAMFLAAMGCAAPAPEAPKGFKAAIVLPGPISDVGWSGPAYQGMEKLKADFGMEISYNENAQAADYETILRGYASQGYNLIFAHGSQFLDAANKVAADFPDVKFAVTSAFETNGTNISGLNMSAPDVGFLVGALCGLMTKSNKIGSVGGSQIPPIMGIVNGTIAGAAYSNPEAVVHNVYLGDADAARCKEAALTLIDGGCDIMTQCADIGSLGAINACTERGILNVSTAGDFAVQAPDTVLTSVLVDISYVIYTAGKMALEGTLEPKVYSFGIKEDVVTMTGYGRLADKVPQEVQGRMEQIIADIKADKLSVADHMPKS